MRRSRSRARESAVFGQQRTCHSQQKGVTIDSSIEVVPPFLGAATHYANFLSSRRKGALFGFLRAVLGTPSMRQTYVSMIIPFVFTIGLGVQHVSMITPDILRLSPALQYHLEYLFFNPIYSQHAQQIKEPNNLLSNSPQA